MGEIINAAGSKDLQTYVDAMLSALTPVFEIEDKDTLLRKLYEVLSTEFVRTDENLQRVRNDNYIKIVILDEIKTRSGLVKDKLDEENAFRVDSIRFVPSDYIRAESLFLDTDQEEVQLFYIPSSIDGITIYETGNVMKTPVTTVLDFDSETNLITIEPIEKCGLYTIEYIDTGDTLEVNENVTVPEDLFEIGYGDGLYGSLGYGE